MSSWRHKPETCCCSKQTVCGGRHPRTTVTDKKVRKTLTTYRPQSASERRADTERPGCPQKTGCAVIVMRELSRRCCTPPHKNNNNIREEFVPKFDRLGEKRPLECAVSAAKYVSFCQFLRKTVFNITTFFLFILNLLKDNIWNCIKLG